MGEENLEARTVREFDFHKHPLLETSAYVTGGAALVTAIMEIARYASEYCCKFGEAFYNLSLRRFW